MPCPLPLVHPIGSERVAPESVHLSNLDWITGGNGSTQVFSPVGPVAGGRRQQRAGGAESALPFKDPKTDVSGVEPCSGFYPTLEGICYVPYVLL